MKNMSLIEKIQFGLLAAIFLLLLSIKMSTCNIENDIRTTKKQAKELNQKSLTQDDLKSLRDTLFSKVDTTDN